MENNQMPVKKKKRKKTVIFAVAAGVILFIAVVGSLLGKVSKGMQEALEQMSGQDDAVFEVERQDVEQEIITSGTVIGIEENAYISPVTAKVEDIRVEVGQTVKKGDVLLTYDVSELGDNLEKVKIQAQAEKAAGNESYEMANEAAKKTSDAEKKIKELKSDIKTLQKEITTLTEEVAGYEEQMAAAEAAEAAAVKEGEAAESEEAEKEKTENVVTVDKKKYDKAVKNLNKKNESLVAKQAELAEQEAVVAANKEVKVSESTKAQISASNQLSDMSVSTAQEYLDSAQAGVTAECDGIISSITAMKGAYASETQTLMTVIRSDKIGVEFSISRDDLGSVSEGQKARVVIAGKEYEGTVAFISRVAVSNATMVGSTEGSITGRIVLDEPDENIYIGVAAKVYVYVGNSKNTLVIPYEALNTDVDGDYVYIVNKENLIERKDITIGIYSDEYYEVVDGIEEGDRVILEVTKSMKPGDEYMGSMAANVTAE